MIALRPRTLRRTAERFVQTFPGDVLYAVKCNPEPTVLRALWRGGVRHFDCASLQEIRTVRSLFADAQIHYMHPIKMPAAIRQAYQEFGVRDFSVDSPRRSRRSWPPPMAPAIWVFICPFGNAEGPDGL